MERVHKHGLTVLNTMVTGATVKPMAKDNLCMLTATYLRVHSATTKQMATVYTRIRMANATRVNG